MNSKKTESYIGLTKSLLESPAMRGLSTNCWKLIHFCMIEHLKNGWNNKGEVAAPYNQLESFGMTRRYISNAIYEAEQRGLIVVERGSKNGLRNYDNKYQLTFAKSQGVKARNNWRRFSEKDLVGLKLQLNEMKN